MPKDPANIEAALQLIAGTQKAVDVDQAIKLMPKKWVAHIRKEAKGMGIPFDVYLMQQFEERKASGYSPTIIPQE